MQQTHHSRALDGSAPAARATQGPPSQSDKQRGKRIVKRPPGDRRGAHSSSLHVRKSRGQPAVSLTCICNDRRRRAAPLMPDEQEGQAVGTKVRRTWTAGWAALASRARAPPVRASQMRTGAIHLLSLRRGTCGGKTSRSCRSACGERVRSLCRSVGRRPTKRGAPRSAARLCIMCSVVLN